MENKKKLISSGIVHEIPEDLKSVLASSEELLNIWEKLSPIARNEWICWIESAIKSDTRVSRINRLSNDLLQGKKRPCCWPGCPHRKKTS